MNRRSSSIAIVGGGSVATSFLRQLAEKLRTDARAHVGTIFVFEPNHQPGAGDAYQPDSSSNLLNTRVASMSPIASDPTHFRNWLLQNESRWQPMFPGLEPTDDSFVPRALFGRYLNDVFVEAVGLLRERGVEVQHVACRVGAIKRTRDAYELTTSHGKSYTVTSVVLAIGNLETNDWDHLASRSSTSTRPTPARDSFNASTLQSPFASSEPVSVRSTPRSPSPTPATRARS